MIVMSEREVPRGKHWFAVQSPTGVHIGLWNDGKIAWDVVAEEGDGYTVMELVDVDEANSLRARCAELEKALEPFAVAERVAFNALGDKADTGHIEAVALRYVRLSDLRLARATLNQGQDNG